MSTVIRARMLEVDDGTAVRVAAEADIALATWWRRMREPGSWRLAELERVAAVLGVDVVDLLRPG